MSGLTRRSVLASGDPRQPANARKSTAGITGPTEVSRLRLRPQIANITTVMRQCSSLTAAAVALLGPATPRTFHTVLMTGLALWAVYRLVTRSRSVIAITGDVGWMVLIATSIPTLATADELSTMVSVPQAVVGVTIATLGVQLPVRWSTAVSAVGIFAYGWGASAVIGWSGALAFHGLYPMVVGWILAMLLGLAIERVARTADQAHQDRLAADVADGIARVRRNFDREQLALLHDTAAATLLLVAETPHVPTERVAAQASRDLMVLQTRPATDHCAPVDVIHMLRDEATYLDVPVHLTGLDHLWLDAERAQALVAASREALNNVDRHANASSVTIYAGRHRLEIADDGRGIASGTARGHGIEESIVGRIRRIGGSAVIHSVPGGGTTVELRWRIRRGRRGVARFCGRQRRVRGQRAVQIRTGSHRHRHPRRHGGAVAGAVDQHSDARVADRSRRRRDAVQPLGDVGGTARHAVDGVGRRRRSYRHRHRSTRDAERVGLAYAAWSQGAVGFCLLPHLLRLPASRGVPMLFTVWAIPAIVTLTRVPTAHMLLVLAAASPRSWCRRLRAACSAPRSATHFARCEQRTRHACASRRRWPSHRPWRPNASGVTPAPWIASCHSFEPCRNAVRSPRDFAVRLVPNVACFGHSSMSPDRNRRCCPSAFSR